MRQWMREVMAGAIFLGTIAPADARGVMGAAGSHAAASRVSARPADAAGRVEAREPKRAFRYGHHGWAVASGAGYGLPWGDGSYDPTDPAEAAPLPPEGYPLAPPLLYGYGPPRHACFKPRLIMIGKAVPKAHLPRVVYGGSLPCSGI